jgi:mono/diheme cytochrome c family protein
MRNRLIVASAAVILVLGGLYAWTREEAIAALKTAPAATAEARLRDGARIVALGDCMVCHTAKGGAPYAGGLPLQTPFGTIYATNITPDPQTGIGNWPLEAFQRALRRGVSRDGHLLYPAFPYVHYTRMSDNDIALAYDYLMSRTPVRARPPANALMFPLNFRPLLAFWNLLYLTPGQHIAPAGPGQVERGRYLVDTLGHCASCHSGLNPIGGERKPAFGGGTVDGWHAPALTTLTQGSAPWTEAELAIYLRTGVSLAHGAAKGPMQPVTEHLAETSEADTTAMARYLTTIQTQPLAATSVALPPVASGDGAALFAASCAACHSASAPMMRLARRPSLARSSAVLGSDPSNFILTVLHGLDGARMPPYAAVLSDGQIASLAAYVRGEIAVQPPWSGIPEKTAQLRNEAQQ